MKSTRSINVSPVFPEIRKCVMSMNPMAEELFLAGNPKTESIPALPQCKEVLHPVKGVNQKAVLKLTFFLAFLWIATVNAVLGQNVEQRGVTPDGAVFDMELKDDILYVGGSFDRVGYHTGGIALMPDGDTLPDLDFPFIKGDVYALIPDGAGGWYAAGDFSTVNLFSRNNVVHILPNMEVNQDFAPNVNKQVNTLALKDGILYMGGLFTMVEGQSRQYFAAWDLSANALDPLDLAPDRNVYDMVIYEDLLVVGGLFGQIGDSAFRSMACVNLSTGIMQSFPQITTGWVNAFHLDGQRLYVAGTFSGGALEVDMASRTVTGWNPGVSGFALSARVNDIWKEGSAIYLGGNFSSVLGTPRKNMAAVSEQGDLLDFAPEPDAEVFSVLAHDNYLYTGGDFKTIAGQVLPHLARFGMDHEPDLSWRINPTWAVHEIDPTTGGMIIGGEFEMLQFEERDAAYALDTRTGKITDWNPAGGFSTVSDLKVDELRNVVYLAGYDFKTMRNVKAFDGTTGHELAGFQLEFNNSVNRIDQDTVTGNLYMVGNFTQVNGEEHTRMVLTDTSGNLLPLKFAADEEVHKVVVSEKHELVYVTGEFNSVNSQTRYKAAAVQLDGTLADWNPQPAYTALPGEYTHIHTILVQEDRVLLGGSFDSIAGVYRHCLAAVNPVSGTAQPWDPEIVSKGSFLASVTLIQDFQNGILITGSNLLEVGGQTFIYLAWLGEQSARNLNMKEVGYFSIHSFLPQGNLLHVGGSFQAIENKFHPFVSTLSFPDQTGNTGDRIEWYSPREGGNAGEVTLEIIGNGFTEGTSVVLRREGLEDIEPALGSVYLYDGVRISATFDLNGAPTGSRDIVITVPGDTTIVLDNAFRLVRGKGPLPWADMIVPSWVTRRTNNLFYLSYGNSGDADAHGVRIWMAFSPNIEVREVGFDIIRLMDEADPFYDSIPSHVYIDSLHGEPYEANVYAFIIPKVPAGSSNMIAVRIYGEENGEFYTRAWVDEPLFGSPLKYWVSECEEAIMMKIIGVVPYASCLAGSIDQMISPFLDFFWDPNFGTSDYALNHLELVFNTAVDCASDLLPIGALKSLAELIQEFLNSKSWFDLAEKCSHTEKDKDDIRGSFISSMDPNDKTGPVGQGESGWLNTNRKFAYLVRFENDPEATAPAKQVVIRDTLQPGTFDLSTLELKGFTIADSVYKISSGYSSYVTVVDLRPRLPYKVRLTGELEMETGALSWEFLTLDPVSLDTVTDPTGGFLPPDTDSISGRGSVFYDVSVYDYLESGTMITNQAAIFFDTNDPIITNEWSLLADNDLPQSQVLQPADTVYTETAELHWTGLDTGSGIRYYDVKFRENGGNWYHAAAQESDTTMVFAGTPGSVYEFVSIAYDSALNEEIKLMTAEARVYFADESLSVGPAGQSDRVQFSIYPNPADETLSIEVKGLEGLMEISIMEITGRVVYQGCVIDPGKHTTMLDISLLPGGFYILNLQTESEQKSSRFIKK